MDHDAPDEEQIRELLAWARSTQERVVRHCEEFHGPLATLLAGKKLPGAEHRRVIDELLGSHRSGLDALRHVALLHGYRQGAAARTDAQAALEAAVATATPVVDTSTSGERILAAVAGTLTVVADALCLVATWPSFEAAPDAPAPVPSKPGPTTTARKAAEHALGLEFRLAGVLAHAFSAAGAPLLEQRARTWQRVSLDEQAQLQESPLGAGARS